MVVLKIFYKASRVPSGKFFPFKEAYAGKLIATQNLKKSFQVLGQLPWTSKGHAWEQKRAKFLSLVVNTSDVTLTASGTGLAYMSLPWWHDMQILWQGKLFGSQKWGWLSLCPTTRRLQQGPAWLLPWRHSQASCISVRRHRYLLEATFPRRRQSEKFRKF